MTNLYLHIGTEKTGTTSIQEFLRMNRSALGVIGSYVPHSLGRSNHQWLPFVFSRDLTVDSFFRMQHIRTDEQRLKAQENMKNVFRDEILNTHSDNWVISSEHLQSCLERRQEIVDLYDELSNHFTTITVLVYLRNPIDTAMSAWSTRIKCGVLAKELVSPNDRRISTVCNHQRTLQIWSEVFGMENLIARIFHAQELVGGDILSDFTSLLWPDMNIINYQQPGRKNESLSALGASILNQVLSLYNVKTSPTTYRHYQQIVQYIMDHTAGCGRLTVSSTSLSQYNSYFMDSNAWVQQNYFPRLFDLWPIKTDINCIKSNQDEPASAWPTTDCLYMLSSKGIQCADEIVRIIESCSILEVDVSVADLGLLENVDLMDLVQ
ncbi:hypothetical protein KBY93_14330 [Synechococcus sp. J7-Johnson]|uniref:hypothetical protein n=1 Tax=Synechococcus sp. J7-Johnson TaxID=2823737 RepID=UPI0020CBECD2|nr:hypothetical protein [Synechococcus sp. J7-Johnson]MCP9841800.1 hypothetical protein [Synechococcus sp. J7-Johnson]